MATSMGCRERRRSFFWLFTDKIFHVATFAVITFTLGIILTSDIFSGAALIIAYFIGCLGVNFIFRSSERKIPNIFLLRKKSKLVNSYRIPQQCTVCGNAKCKRHRSDLNIYVLKPWSDLMIPNSINESLEEILSLTLNEYIYSWHRLISSDESFVQEIRLSLRFLISSLLTRAMQVDVIDIITDKLAKALLQHLDCYLHAKARSKSAELSQQMVLNSYGPSLHVALKSRDSEVRYLRSLVEALLPYCLPKKFLLCRSSMSLTREVFCISVLLPVMDIIADPDIVNHLLLILFDKTPMKDYPDSTEESVELLDNFINTNDPHKRPVLQTDLQTILSTQHLLFSFMQFLKEEVSVNVLQFCLDVDDFSNKMLNPDLNKEKLKELQKVAKNMYSTYFSPDAVDKIKFPDEIAKQIKDVVYGPVEDIIKLRTTTPLFRAYDHAYNLLENTFCPMFHQSDQYFNLLCGERWSSSVAKNLNRIPKKGNEASAMSKLSHKIKGVFVPNIDEGQLFEEEAGTDLAITVFSDDALAAELYEANRLDDDPRLKNLSAWRVSIPCVETLMDQNCKYYDAFSIEVQRIDVKGKDNPEDFHWMVKRRYHEFYVLEAKLREFHGELPDIQLPPKRSIRGKGKQFLESRRVAFEKFLQDLLSLPTLQSSELLYRFLKSPVMFTAGFLPEINLGKMIKTVPMKLLKEKGQHLEPFLQALMSSTEAAKPKPSKVDWKDIYEVPAPPVMKKIERSMYNDNSAVIQGGLRPNFIRPRKIISLDGIYDYLLYLAVRVYHAPSWWIQVMITFDAMIRHTLQGFVEWYLDRKVKQILKPQRVVEVIHLLRDAIFFDKDLPRTENQKKQREMLALEQAKEFFPDWLVWILGHARHEEGTKCLLSTLQHPLLNKQLSYVLLDIIVLELFPELRLKNES